MRPDLCRTFHTTPPFPAPNSPNFSNSSADSSPIFCLSCKNISSLFLCKSSMSNSSSFFCKSSTLAPDMVLFLLQNERRGTSEKIVSLWSLTLLLHTTEAILISTPRVPMSERSQFALGQILFMILFVYFCPFAQKREKKFTQNSSFGKLRLWTMTWIRLSACLGKSCLSFWHNKAELIGGGEEEKKTCLQTDKTLFRFCDTHSLSFAVPSPTGGNCSPGLFFSLYIGRVDIKSHSHSRC